MTQPLVSIARLGRTHLLLRQAGGNATGQASTFEVKDLSSELFLIWTCTVTPFFFFLFDKAGDAGLEQLQYRVGRSVHALLCPPRRSVRCPGRGGRIARMSRRDPSESADRRRRKRHKCMHKAVKRTKAYFQQVDSRDRSENESILRMEAKHVTPCMSVDRPMPALLGRMDSFRSFRTKIRTHACYS